MKNKKILILFYIFFSMIFLCANKTYAAKSGDFEYNFVTENNVEITGYSGKSKELIIPNSIDDHKVIGIGEKVFELNSYIDKVIVEEGIEYIKYGAFWCSQLSEIQLPKSLVKLEGLSLAYTKLKEIKIPEKITEISKDIFGECIYLERVELPENISTIGEDAFADCPKLKKINIPDNIKEIKDFAFSGCSNLKEINLPKNLEIIGEHVFECTGLVKIKIPEGTQKIGKYAFCSCEDLEKITIPSTVKTIGKFAFKDSPDIVIYAPYNSYAIEYAKKYKIDYKINNYVKLSKCSIDKIKNQSYNGKNIKPKIVVRYKNEILKKNRDYTITYKNNKNIGKAVVTIKGKGRCSGSISKSFYIAPKKAKIKTIKNKSKKTAEISWKKDNRATGYEIFMSSYMDKNFKKIVSISINNKTKFLKNKLKKGQCYYFKIRSYKKINGKKIYGDYSDIKYLKI